MDVGRAERQLVGQAPILLTFVLVSQRQRSLQLAHEKELGALETDTRLPKLGN